MPAAPRKHLLQLPQMHSSVQPQGMASAALLRVGGTASLVENTRTPRTFMMYLDDPCRQKKCERFACSQHLAQDKRSVSHAVSCYTCIPRR